MDADFTSLGSSMKIDPKDLVNKAKGVCRDPELLKKIVACGVKMGKVSAACAMMPKKWNKDRVFAWAKVYNYSFK